MNAADRGQLRGHRSLRLGRGPFAGVVPALLLAAVWFTVAAAAGLAGVLPGGRWTVVHLFTLGVLTNLLLAFSQHFARAVTRSSQRLGRWHLPLLNGGVLGVLVGMLTGRRLVLVAGAVAVLAVVAVAWRQLRRMRRAAATSRFTWVVRAYEHAHGAFVLGALGGALLGAGALPASWYAGVRLAHLHLMLLGWAGLVVVATVVVFGPALLRVRLPAGAEPRAARALRVGAVGLLGGALLLTGSALPGMGGVLLRVGGAAGIGVSAWPVWSVTRSVLRAAARAHPGAARPLLAAALLWYSAALGAAVPVLAAGAVALLHPLGIAFGVGVLLQLILAVGLFLLPSLRGRDFASRDALLARTERGALPRALVLNAATLAVSAAPLLPAGQAAVGAAGWTAVVAVVAHTLLLAALPVTADPSVARSSVARRYRTAEAPR